MKSKRGRKFRVTVISAIAVSVIYFLGWMSKLLIKNKKNFTDILEKGEYPLLAFWHGRQFFGFYPQRKHSYVIPASLSEDGDIVEKTLGSMGHTIVRGSSSKRAVALVVEMIREVKKGKGLALSVDGPRGPFREAKMGIIQVAQKTGQPILPMLCSASRMWISKKSWDRFMIPKPFSRVLMQFGEPIYVPKNASKQELESYRQTLQQALEKGYQEVDGYFGKPDLEKELKASHRDTENSENG